MSQKDTPVVDWAVVGGGVSGLYAAWRLAQVGCNSLRIFEAGADIGGRLLSVRIPGTGHIAELGAMRHCANQLIIRGLITELNRIFQKGLAEPEREAFMLKEVPFRWPTAELFLRGQWVQGDLDHCRSCHAPTGLPYRLRRDESAELALELQRQPTTCGSAPVILVKRAIRLALQDVQGVPREDLRDLDNISGATWSTLRKSAKLGNVPLHDVGFWNLMQAYLSPEAVLLVRDAFGYESIVCNWNVAEAIRWFLDDFATDYYAIDGGMQRLILALERALSLRLGTAPVDCSMRLVKVTRPDEFFLLHFRNLDPNAVEKTPEVRARHVILALPQAALQAIRLDDLVDEASIEDWEDQLKSVTAQVLTKVLLAYDEPWWKFRGSKGRIVTDLPIRQAYFYPPPAGQMGPKAVRAAVMATYNDGHYSDFWRPLLNEREKQPPFMSPALKRELENDPAEAGYESDLAIWGVPERLVRKAHRQLELLHGQRVPDPITGLARRWTAPKLSDGWHTWNVPSQPWKVLNSVQHPFKSLPLYVCGEAFSAEQGWIEGALRSTEGMLKATKNVAVAEWLSKLDYAGRKYESLNDYIDSDA